MVPDKSPSEGVEVNLKTTPQRAKTQNSLPGPTKSRPPVDHIDPEKIASGVEQELGGPSDLSRPQKI